jgi:hypothetical protein
MKLRNLVLAIALSGAAMMAAAVEKRFPTDEGQTLVINGGADWVAGVNPPSSPIGTVTINGPDPKLWRISVGPLPPHPTLTADPGNLRMYMRMWARGMENGGIQVEPEHKQIQGRDLSGIYVKIHDGRKKTKAQIKKSGGEFTDAYVGALSIGGNPYLFEVSWISGGESAANTALAAVKTIRIH